MSPSDRNPPAAVGPAAANDAAAAGPLSLSERLQAYLRLTRLHRPIGILLLIWPTLWALFVAADGWPPAYALFAFCLGTVLMRSAGCAINDYADRDIDGYVKRTVDRPLARGLIAPWEAVAVFVVLCLLALPLVFPFGPLVWALTVVAAILAGSYPYFKRFFAVPQAYLGIAFGFGIPMAFAALTDTVPLSAWIMLLANIFWTIAYDTEYAMVDRDDDLKLGIRTSAITFGRHDVKAVMFCYGMALLLMAWVGVREQLFPGLWVGLLLAAGIAAYHWLLIRRRERADCFKAFNHNNWFGAAIFLGVLLGVFTG